MWPWSTRVKASTTSAGGDEQEEEPEEEEEEEEGLELAPSQTVRVTSVVPQSNWPPLSKSRRLPGEATRSVSAPFSAR